MVEIDSSLETLLEKIHEFMRSETIIGKPLAVGEVTLIPVVRVTLGAGSGSGGSISTGRPNGAGAGAVISPQAIIVLRGENVSVLPVTKTSPLEKITDMVPGIIEDLEKKRGHTTDDQ